VARGRWRLPESEYQKASPRCSAVRVDKGDSRISEELRRRLADRSAIAADAAGYRWRQSPKQSRSYCSAGAPFKPEVPNQ